MVCLNQEKDLNEWIRSDLREKWEKSKIVWIKIRKMNLWEKFIDVYKWLFWENF